MDERDHREEFGLTWREVLTDWCDPSATPVPARTPAPLAEFLAAGGAAALSSQNHFQVPIDEDGWSVFYVENQGVCTWAYRTDDPEDDPHVYVRVLPADSPSYVSVGCRLDAFLSGAAVIEAVFGASIFRSGDCPPSRVDDLLGLPRVQLPELGWPTDVTTAYYRARDVLAFAQHVRDEPRAYVFVAARRPEALSDIDERFSTSPEWDCASWGPGFDEP